MEVSDLERMHPGNMVQAMHDFNVRGMDSSGDNTYLGGFAISAQVPFVQRVPSKHRGFLAAATALLALWLGGLPAAWGKGQELVLEPCELNLPGTGLTARAECGFLEVAENPADPAGRQIRLRDPRGPSAASRGVGLGHRSMYHDHGKK